MGAPPTTFPDIGAVSTDTRALETGALFVALVGERFDAHEFLGEACARGAAAAVVRRGTPPVSGLPLVIVDDTVEALGDLARTRRRGLTGPVVAITGTNGKTSTKEMVARVLASRWNTHATRANQNNLIGVPLTLLEASDACEAVVVEVGASERGEVARSREIVEPDIAVVTNVSAGHLEGFGSLDDVLEEKVSLVRDVAVAIVGSVPTALAQRADELATRTVRGGVDASADVRPDRHGVRAHGRGWFTHGDLTVELGVVGLHQIENAMLAFAVGVELGLSASSIANALEHVVLPAGRCDVRTTGERVIVQDTYNANPGSVAALLQTAAQMRQDRRLVVVLGSMLELGSESESLHAQVADAVMSVDPDCVAVIGEFIPAFRTHAERLADRLITADDVEMLGRLLAARLGNRDLILVKGSRGMYMEKVVPFLLADDEAKCSTTC